MRWDDDWPVIGVADPSATTGEPVMAAPIPDDKGNTFHQPQTSDEFTGLILGRQWEWNDNPDNAYWTLLERPGSLRMKPMFAPDLLHARNTLTQVMQDESFELTERIDLTYIKDHDRVGLAMFEKNASGLKIVQDQGK